MAPAPMKSIPVVAEVFALEADDGAEHHRDDKADKNPGSLFAIGQTRAKFRKKKVHDGYQR